MCMRISEGLGNCQARDGALLALSMEDWRILASDELGRSLLSSEPLSLLKRGTQTQRASISFLK